VEAFMNITKRLSLVFMLITLFVSLACKKKVENKSFLSSDEKSKVNNEYVQKEKTDETDKANSLDSVFKLWSEGNKDQALESFINLNWEGSEVKTQNELLNMSEKKFTSLTLDKQAEIRKRILAFTSEIRELVKSVILESQKSLKNKNDADAEKGLNAALKFGEYLSNLDTLSAIKMTGSAVKKIVLNELLNFYTQTNQQEKLKTIKKQLSEQKTP